MPRININHLSLEPQEIEPSDQDLEISETGPWEVDSWDTDGKTLRIGLFSQDFHHDACLEIMGDFHDDAQKLRYANLLADRMNRMPKE